MHDDDSEDEELAAVGGYATSRTPNRAQSAAHLLIAAGNNIGIRDAYENSLVHQVREQRVQQSQTPTDPIDSDRSNPLSAGAGTDDSIISNSTVRRRRRTKESDSMKALESLVREMKEGRASTESFRNQQLQGLEALVGSVTKLVEHTTRRSSGK